MDLCPTTFEGAVASCGNLPLLRCRSGRVPKAGALRVVSVATYPVVHNNGLEVERGLQIRMKVHPGPSVELTYIGIDVHQPFWVLQNPQLRNSCALCSPKIVQIHIQRVCFPLN